MHFHASSGLVSVSLLLRLLPPVVALLHLDSLTCSWWPSGSGLLRLDEGLILASVLARKEDSASVEATLQAPDGCMSTPSLSNLSGGVGCLRWAGQGRGCRPGQSSGSGTKAAVCRRRSAAFTGRHAALAGNDLQERDLCTAKPLTYLLTEWLDVILYVLTALKK